MHPYLTKYLTKQLGGRAGADTKTKKSRRTLALPQRCVDALQAHRVRQERVRQTAGRRWQDNELVFPSAVGAPRGRLAHAAQLP